MADIDKTLKYYNENAQSFASGTVSVKFTKVQDKFLEKLNPDAYILDFGCGAGRDTKYFLSRGYQVDAVDGSEQLWRIASEYTGIKVTLLGIIIVARTSINKKFFILERNRAKPKPTKAALLTVPITTIPETKMLFSRYLLKIPEESPSSYADKVHFLGISVGGKATVS